MKFFLQISSSMGLAVFFTGMFIIHSEPRADDDIINGSTDAAQLGQIAADKFGKKGAAKLLGKATRFGIGVSIAQNIKDGNIPGVVGDIVEAGTGIITVPTGVAAGTVVAGPVGGVVGGGVGMAIADYRGKQAEEYTRKLIEKFTDNRSDLQKRMDVVGLDNNIVAENYDFRTLGQRAKYEIELRKKLLDMEFEQANSKGESYLPDPKTKQEIAELEEALNNIQPTALPDTDTPSPSSIPFSAGEGIRCGPVSAAEREQVQNELGVDVKKLVEGRNRARKRVGAARRHVKNMNAIGQRDTGVGTESIGRGAKLELDNAKESVTRHNRAISKAVVKVRDQNGLCPAPKLNEAGAGTAKNEPNSPQSGGSSSNISNDTGVPAGYKRITPNACRSQIGDVVRC